jgi:hypothetical protein
MASAAVGAFEAAGAMSADDIAWQHAAPRARILPTCLVPAEELHGELWIAAVDAVLEPEWLRERKVTH